MQSLKTPSSILMCAAPMAGKSYMISYLLYCLCKLKRFNHVLVFSPTAHDDYKFVPENWRYDDWQPDVVKHHMAQQKKFMAEGKNIQMAVVFDDIIGTFNMKDKLIEKLMTTFRHYNMTVFVATQWVYACPPSIRNSASYVFIFQQSMARAFDALYESFGQLFETKEQFKRVINSCTHDYNVLMYDRMAPNDIKKKYKVVKAGVVPANFKLVDAAKQKKSQIKNINHGNYNSDEYFEDDDEGEYSRQGVSYGMPNYGRAGVYSNRGRQQNRFAYLQ